MTISILNECLLLRNSPVEELKQYFKKINVSVFDTVLSKFEENEARQTVLFIVCGYSEDSPLQILRQDNKEEKLGICEFLQIPEFLRANLMNLKDQEVRKAVTTYLNQFAGPLYKSWQFLKIQLQDLENDITNRSFSTTKESPKENEDGEPSAAPLLYWDLKEHFKAVKLSGELSKQIEALEDVIKNKIKKMEGIEEMANFLDKEKKAGKITGGRRGNVEGYVK